MPKKRWLENVEDDVRMIGVRGRKRTIQGRGGWDCMIEKAKTYREL